MSEPKKASGKTKREFKTEENYGAKMKKLLEDRKTTKRVISKKKAKR